MARPTLSQPCPTYPLGDVLAGVALATFALVGLNAACGTTASTVQCKVAAVELLPTDPMQVTPYDVDSLVTRLRACDATGDAGK